MIHLSIHPAQARRPSLFSLFHAKAAICTTTPTAAENSRKDTEKEEKGRAGIRREHVRCGARAIASRRGGGGGYNHRDVRCKEGAV